MCMPNETDIINKLLEILPDVDETLVVISVPLNEEPSRLLVDCFSTEQFLHCDFDRDTEATGV